MDLFEYARELNKDKESPLAGRMRPATLDEVVGQEHIIGKDKLLYRAIKADKISSIIFYGPPGTGKTTLAEVIANTTKANFVQMNATTSGKKDMQEAVADAKESLGMYQKKTILFIDEIHRFNKAQQDYLLPFVEDGTIILIGATTENPYFEVNQALISRSNVFELHSLDKEDIKKLIVRAITDDEKGMGIYGATITDDALDFLSDMAEGDARSALNAIELGILTTEPAEDGKIHIDIDVAQECIQRRVTKYDKDGDNHYDVISAFIKSMRGSDPDAAIYYLARMIDAGESVTFIARRIMICASEDVGNADPQALQVAVAASQAVERIGMPEARIILAQAVTYVASAPKSNAAYMAVDQALESVRNHKIGAVPNHLRDAHYKGAAKLGHGIGYKYAHDYPDRPSGGNSELHVLPLQRRHPVLGEQLRLYRHRGQRRGRERRQLRLSGDEHLPAGRHLLRRAEYRRAQAAPRADLDVCQPVLGVFLRRGLRRALLRLRHAASGALFAGPGGDSGRPEPHVHRLRPVFPLRHYGRDDRRAARRGLFAAADDRFADGRVRVPHFLGHDGVCRKPEDGLPDALLSGFVGADVRGSGRHFHRALEKGSKALYAGGIGGTLRPAKASSNA